MAQKTNDVQKCGFFAILLMIVTGTILGTLAVVLAHIGMKYYPDYYLLLIFPIFIGLLLGSGLSFGARAGRCGRMHIFAFLVVLIFSVLAYTSLLFLNHYYEALPEQPKIVLDEFFQLKDDTQNFLAALPYISDYVAPVQQSEGIETRPHIGTQIMTYITTALPEQAFSQEPVVVGTIFDLALLAPVRDYLIYPGMTRWNEELNRLEFDERAVQPWMVWSAEIFMLWLIAFLKTLKGTKKARQKREERLKKRGPWQSEVKPLAPEKEEKKGLFRRKKKDQASPKQLDVTPSQAEQEATLEPELSAQAEPKKEKKKLFSFGRKKKTEPETDEEAIETPTQEEKQEKKKKKKGWFRKKSKDEAPETPDEKDAKDDVHLDLPKEDEQEQRYALILHQYETTRQDDLVWLIQQVSHVPEERARKLLKVPSLLKRDVTTEEAQIAIDKFKQVQAQVKLITMQQLEEIQNKQKQTVQAAQPAQAQKPTGTAQPAPASSKQEDNGERYALILRKIDPAQRKQILELLSSLSNTPVAQLQQNLKTPALVLRDASKDEVTMIAQQFRMIQADVKMLTMTELQKLMARK